MTDERRFEIKGLGPPSFRETVSKLAAYSYPLIANLSARGRSPSQPLHGA